MPTSALAFEEFVTSRGGAFVCGYIDGKQTREDATLVRSDMARLKDSVHNFKSFDTS